jgi:hypothetical protein
MFFYTTKEQEVVLDFDYNNKIEQKTKEIEQKELETGQIRKWTAYAFVKKEPRSFYKIDGLYYVKINGKKYPYKFKPENQDDKPNFQNFGVIYKVDFDFYKELNKFINDNLNWKIIFYPNKKDGCISYISSNESDTPAEIISLEDKKIKLVLENNEKYDICCG